MEQNKLPSPSEALISGDRKGGVEPSQSRTNLFTQTCAMPFTPLDGGNCHLPIQKRVWEEPGDPPALRKLGQSRLVTSLLIEAASAVWIFF